MSAHQPDETKPIYPDTLKAFLDSLALWAACARVEELNQARAVIETELLGR